MSEASPRELNGAQLGPVSSNSRRVVTALLAAPVVVALAYVGGWPFAALVALIGILGQRELYLMARQVGARPHRLGGFVLGLFVVAMFLRPALWPLAAATLLLFVVAAPLLLPQDQFLVSFAVTIAGIVYPTALLGSLVWLREVRSAAVTDGGAADGGRAGGGSADGGGATDGGAVTYRSAFVSVCWETYFESSPAGANRDTGAGLPLPWFSRRWTNLRSSVPCPPRETGGWQAFLSLHVEFDRVWTHVFRDFTSRRSVTDARQL